MSGKFILRSMLLWCAAGAAVHAAAPRVAQPAGKAAGIVLTASFSPSAIEAGDNTVFSWQVTGSSTPGSCLFTGVPGLDIGDLAGSITLAPTANLRADVDCSESRDGGWRRSAFAELVVVPAGSPPSVSARFMPTTVPRGQNTRLIWSSENAASCSRGDTGATLPTSGSFFIVPEQDLSLTITCVGPRDRTGSSTASVRVAPAEPPEVVIFAGTGGTRLYANDFLHEQVWVGFPYLPLVPLREWNLFLRRHLELKDDPHSNDPIDVLPVWGPGVRLGTSAGEDDGLRDTGCIVNDAFGLACAYAYLTTGILDSQSRIADYLRDRGIKVKAFAYDWRLAFERHYPTIRATIDAAYARGGNHQVYVVAHSQGTQLLRAFLMDNPGYRDRIRMVFNVAAPHLGSPLAAQYTIPATGGGDFGLGGPPTFLMKPTGLSLGGHSPSSYAMNPWRELLRIIRYNTGEWPFTAYAVDEGNRRLAPGSDSLDAAHDYMRSLAISPSLFDRSTAFQARMANSPHNLPTYEITSISGQQPGIWIKKHYASAGHNVGSSYMTLAGDGSIPAISSLGRFSGAGAHHRGTLRIDANGERTDHQQLLSNHRALDFIHRTILRDRRFDDPGYEADFVLETDEQILQQIGWALPPAAAGSEVLPKRGRPLVPKISMVPLRTFEFSTRQLDAVFEIALNNLVSGEKYRYAVSKAGVALLAFPEEFSSDPSYNFNHPAPVAVPVLVATTDRIFGDGLDPDRDGVINTPSSIAGDLATLTVQMSMDDEDYEVTLTPDRPVEGMARLFLAGAQVSGSRRSSDAQLQQGTHLRYVKDAATGPEGRLLHVDALGASSPVELFDE